MGAIDREYDDDLLIRLAQPTAARLRHNAPIDAAGGGPRLAMPPIVTAGDCAGGAGGTITFNAVALDASWDAT